MTAKNTLFLTLLFCLILFAGCAQNQGKNQEWDEKPQPEVLTLLNKVNGILIHPIGIEHRDSLKLALTYIDEAIRIQPKLFSLYSNKVTILCELMEFEKALRTIQQTDKMGKKSISGTMMQGYIYDKLAKNDSANLKYIEAYNLCDSLVKTQPNNLEIQAAKALALFFIKGKEEAKKEINNVLAKEPTNVSANSVKNTIENYDRKKYIEELFH